jgi:uncharacterized membrane protein YkvI
LFGDFKNIFKVASIYMATIIGAGFASGQEIMQFFSSYYEGGFYGIILAGILFAIIGYVVLDKVYCERIRNYEEFLFPTVGWFLGWVMEILVTMFMISVFCIMIAGAGEIISDKLSIPYHLAVLMVALICAMVFFTEIKGIINISSIITPMLIVGILGFGLYIIMSKEMAVFNFSGSISKITNNWFFSSLLYVSYNSITSVVVMCSLLPYLKDRKTAALGGVLGGVMLCLMAVVINFAIYLFYPQIATEDLPVMAMVDKYSVFLGGIYTIILLLAMFVSALTAGFGFVERICGKINVNKKIIILIICAISIPLSNVGFSGLISNIYPIFGYMGMFMVFTILIQLFTKVPFYVGVEGNRRNYAHKIGTNLKRRTRNIRKM